MENNNILRFKNLKPLNMKKLTLLMFLAMVGILTAQSPKAINANEVTAFLHSEGYMFSGEDFNPGFIVKSIEGESVDAATIYSSNIWFSAINESGEVVADHSRYNGNGGSPFHEVGIYEENNYDFDKVWTVKGEDILAHKKDFLDGQIDEVPSDDILMWPANGNQQLGVEFPGGYLAPFFDRSADGIYDPYDGDYPSVFVNDNILIPQEMAFSVYNMKEEIMGEESPELQVNVIMYTLNCNDIDELNRAVFTKHIIINKSTDTYKNTNVGLWLDHDIGSYSDDFIGCNAERDLFYAYNSDSVDGPSTSGEKIFGNNPPVQGSRILSHDMTSFVTPSRITAGGFPGMDYPETAVEARNFLNGKWRDGTSLSYGKTGYNPATQDASIRYIFPDSPLDIDGWSMFTDDAGIFDRTSVASVFIGDLFPEQTIELDMVHMVTTESSLDHIEKVDKHFDEMDILKNFYNNLSTENCNLNVVSNEEIEFNSEFTILPNPAKDIIQIESEENIEEFLIYNSAGILIDQIIESTNSSISIDYTPGVYFISAKIGGKRSEIQKLVVY